jgi:flagellar hook-associated protein 3 FlgL
MNINAPNGYNSAIVSRLASMRDELDDLNRQVGTGKKSETYGGLGSGRSLAASFQSKLDTIDGYKQTISLLGVRLKTASTTLDRMNKLATEVRGAFDPNIYNVLSDGRTAQQQTAQNAFSETIDLLNGEVGGRYIFGGRATDQPPVESFDRIMNGYGSQAGFKQVASERRQADLGASGMGRVAVSTSGSIATLASDGTHPFGFKITAVTSSLTNAVVNGPSGSPTAVDIDLSAGQPNAKDGVTYSLTMPDGTLTAIKLTAGAVNDAQAGTFAIGVDTNATAANLSAVLTQSLLTAAATKLSVASGMQAADEFFDTFAGQPAKRVAGPPFASATALQDATASDTVAWYKGDNAPALGPNWSPRSEVSARVDSSVTVSYGMRANERAFTDLIKNYAVVMIADVSGNTANDKLKHSELMTKAKTNLATNVGSQSLQTVQMEISSAFVTNDRAKSRHNQTYGSLDSFLQDIQGVDKTEVSVKLGALQTQLNASYQATSILLKLSLTNYL